MHLALAKPTLSILVFMSTRGILIKFDLTAFCISYKRPFNLHDTHVNIRLTII
jgi:hypothetical protein